MIERNLPERVSAYVDGELNEAQAAALAVRVAEDPQVQRELEIQLELREILAIRSEEAPPVSLLPRVMEAVEAARTRRVVPFRMPRRVEQALVLASAASLAAVVATSIRALQGPAAAPLLGKAAVGTTQAMGAMKSTMVGTVESAGHLDWVARLVPTLAQAAGTAIEPNLGLLGACSVLASGIFGLAAWALLRRSRRGGWGHATIA